MRGRFYNIGEYGTQQVIDELKTQYPNLNYSREVSLSVNGITYRADFIYYDNKMQFHIVEVKAGVIPGFTKNQRLTIPALQSGINVKIVPFGKNASNFFNKPLPNQINKYTFDFYWLKK